MAGKTAMPVVSMMLCLVFVASIDAVLDVSASNSLEPPAFRPGLPEELLSVAELNSLSSEHLAERLRAELSLPRHLPALKEGAARSVVSRTAYPLGALMKRRLNGAVKWFQSFTEWCSSGTKRMHRPVVLLKSTSASNLEANNTQPPNGSMSSFLPRLAQSQALMRSCCALVLICMVLFLVTKELRFVKLRFQSRVQLQMIRNVVTSMTEITTQFICLEQENSALKAALRATTTDRDSIQAQVGRLSFERDNFKESLSQFMKPAQGPGRTQAKFREDSDVLGRYADREWQLKQRLVEADKERTMFLSDGAKMREELSETKDMLESVRYALDVEIQKTASLRVERDLYVNFARLSSSHKKHMAQLIAEVDERRAQDEQKLKRKTVRLMDLIVKIDSELQQRLSVQQQLITAFNDALHNLGVRTSRLYGFAADFQAALHASVSECSVLGQSVASELEARNQDFERYLGKIQHVSERIRQIVVDVPAPTSLMQKEEHNACD